MYKFTNSFTNYLSLLYKTEILMCIEDAFMNKTKQKYFELTLVDGLKAVLHVLLVNGSEEELIIDMEGE